MIVKDWFNLPHGPNRCGRSDVCVCVCVCENVCVWARESERGEKESDKRVVKVK